MSAQESATLVSKELTDLARKAGAADADLVILAEGNCAYFDSATGRFAVKASGAVMGNAQNDDWVWLDLGNVIDVLDDALNNGVTPEREARLNTLLADAVTADGQKRKASIETPLHAIAFHLLGVSWSLHTHPTPVVALASSKKAREHFERAVFPEEAVMCGAEPLFTPYADPGLAVGCVIYEHTKKYLAQKGVTPGQMVLANHGLATFGNSASEALSTTQMAVKASRIRLGALAAGGIEFMPAAGAQSMVNRQDAKSHRQQLMDDLKKA